LSGYKTDTCTVAVTEPIAVTGVELEKNLFLVVGSSGLLRPTFYPANATNNNVRWISYNTDVATVTNSTVNGVTVNGVAAGKTTIVVIAEDGGFDAACTVTVAPVAPPVDGMIWIKPGTFMMGSPFNEPESFDNEFQHQVTLTEGFYMGKYPVTQRQFLDIMGYNDSAFPNPYYDDLYANEWSQFPVETVNWYEAIIFCNKLSMKEGKSPAYTMYKESAPYSYTYFPEDWVDVPRNWSTDPDDWGYLPWNEGFNTTRWDNVRVVAGSDGYRLPTEAQWEYACRAGTITPFNTGNNVTTNQANYDGRYPYNNGGQYDASAGVMLWQTVPAGKYAPNEWGLYDMHGNVWEWCWDWYGSYVRGAATDTDPKGPDTGNRRIVRGGSYYDDGGYLRSACRNVGHPALDYVDQIGFRVVLPYSAPGESRAREVAPTVKMERKMVPPRNFDRTSASPVRLQAVRRKEL
jgi:formylglycine-generating enzyme required for sulfatase activity